VFAGVMSEAALIALGGAAIGLVLAYLAVRAVGNAVQTTNPPFWMDFYLSPPAIAFVLAATLFAAFIAGIVPALQASKANVNVILQDARAARASASAG
ncbi:MAG: FtsX-like permease family protein, partial [Thermoanaerobaculia bacterium]|nr:FtsX-like permease family protein [Thermoanaerobaculia bacterium]